MKKYIFMLLTGVAAVACVGKEMDFAPDSGKESFSMTVYADDAATKTVLSDNGGGSYSVSWQVGDRLGVFEVGNSVVQEKAMSEPLASASSNASFSFALDGDPVAPYDYSFVYPASALGIKSAHYAVTIPASQTFTAGIDGSFDPKADVLVSSHVHTDVRPNAVDVEFARLGGTVRMVINAPVTTEKIRWIKFETTDTNLAGSYELNPETGDLDDDMLEGEKALVLHSAGETDYSGEVVVWFRVAAANLSQDFTVTVQTDGKKYTKEVNLTAASRTLRFANGKLTNFSLDMSSVTGTPAPVDVIDLAFTHPTKASTYFDWEYDGSSSSALYKGNSQKPGAEANTIGLRSGTGSGTVHAGIVTTESGGYIKQIVVKLPIHASERTLDVYANNIPYSNPNDLWSPTNSVKGTKVFSVSTSTTEEVTQTLTFTSNYQYVGFRCNSNSMEVSQIQIVWQEGKMPTASVTTGSASAITSSRATLAGSFDGATGTIYETGFYWDTDADDLAALAHPERIVTGDGSSEASGNFSCTVGSLSEKTTYYYKAYVLEYDEDNLQYVERFGTVQSFETLEKAEYHPGGWLELPSYDIDDMDGTTSSDLDALYPVNHSAMMGGIQQRNYTLLYDADMYASYWVAYPLCDSHLSTGRVDSWAYDPDVPVFLQTNLTNGAYGVNVDSEAYPTEQYYARGHQIPNADRNAVSEMMAQTYYMTNVTPQLQNGFNAHIWADLEEAVRNVVKSTNVVDTVYVVTGAAFRDKTVAEPETIKTIVNKRDDKTLPVPNYYWKVLLKVHWEGSTVVAAKTIGFWLEHRDDLKLSGHVYSDYVTSVDEIEAKTGFNFFPNIGVLQDLDGVENNADWDAFKNF